VGTNWVIDSDTSNHTTSNVSNTTTIHPPNSTDPLSIIVDNGSALLFTSVGDMALPSPFYLNNILVAPNIIQNIFSFLISQLTIGVYGI
jgi:hypothetical protein